MIALQQQKSIQTEESKALRKKQQNIEDLIREKDLAKQMLKAAEKKQEEVEKKLKNDEAKEEAEMKIKEVQKEKESTDEVAAVKSSILKAVNEVANIHKQKADQEGTELQSQMSDLKK